MRHGQSKEAWAMTTMLGILEQTEAGLSLGTGMAGAPSETTIVRATRKQRLGDQGSDRAIKYSSNFYPGRLTLLFGKKEILSPLC
jgi:hypothetical protein